MLEVIRAIPGIEEYTDVPSGRTLHTLFRQVHIRERSNRSHISTYSLLQGGNPANHARIAIWGGAEYASGNASQGRCELRDMPPPSWDAYVKARDSGMMPPELERAGVGFLELATFLIWAFDQAGVVEHEASGRIDLSTPQGDIRVLADGRTGEMIEATVRASGETRWAFSGSHAEALFPARCPREIRMTYALPGSGHEPGDVVLIDSAKCIPPVDPAMFEWQTIARTAVHLPSGRTLDSTGAMVSREPPDRSSPPLVANADGTLEVAPGSVTPPWAWGATIAVGAVAIVAGLLLRRRIT